MSSQALFHQCNIYLWGLDRKYFLHVSLCFQNDIYLDNQIFRDEFF